MIYKIIFLLCIIKPYITVLCHSLYPASITQRQDTGGRYLGPADITGQLVSVQNSVMVPYSMLIWLKKSTAKRKG